MEIGLEAPYGRLGTLFPLSAGNPCVVGVLFSSVTFFVTEFTSIGHRVYTIPHVV